MRDEGGCTCTMDGCTRPAARGGLCWTHVKRRQRKQVLAAEVLERPKSSLERLNEAALEYANAESDTDFDRAADNLRKAGKAYGRGVGESVEQLLREEMARRGALGGTARAERLTPERRAELARLAALARWRRA